MVIGETFSSQTMPPKIPLSAPKVHLADQVQDVQQLNASEASRSATSQVRRPRSTSDKRHQIFREAGRLHALQKRASQLSAHEKTLVKQTYEENRNYHGTGHKKEIERVGLDTRRKTAGATKAVADKQPLDETLVETAKHFNYFTQNKVLAKYFAITGSGDTHSPGLARALFNRERMQLERDPDMETDPASPFYDTAHRTSASVPPEFLLHTKNGIRRPPTAAIRVFREKLAEKGVKVSVRAAASLLRQEQSDSEDDFPVDGSAAQEVMDFLGSSGSQTKE